MVDVLFYFSGVHACHIHKYINLYNHVKKSVSAAMFIDNGRWGLSHDIIKLYESQEFNNLQDIYTCDVQGACTAMMENNFKVGVFGSNYRKDFLGDLDIKTLKY